MDCVLFKIRRASNCYATRAANRLRRWNFTHTRVDVFVIHARVLAHHGVVYQSDIRARLGITRRATSVMMSRLERRGLIARRRSEEDRRKVVVAITDLGRSAFGEVRALVGEQLLTPDVNANLFFHDFKTSVPITRSRFLGYLGVILQQFGDWSRAPYPP